MGVVICFFQTAVARTIRRLKIKMKKILCILLCLTALFLISCASNGGNSDKTTLPSDGYGIYSSQIKALEDKLSEMQQSQYISDAESQKKIRELENQIASLKSAAAESVVYSSTDISEPHFLYNIEDGHAVITGFSGTETNIVIPCAIDGFEVVSIADSAFASSEIKNVIITDGISEIGWFAFNSCKSLTSVTVASSVTKIGYSAFDGCAKGFTVYCHDNSFAKSYAASYGIPYALI